VEQFKKDLMNIARTTLSSKILQGKKDYFAKLCVDAVLKLHVKFSDLIFLSKKTKNSFIGSN
jgi:T-complex protein 1 subunit beta